MPAPENICEIERKTYHGDAWEVLAHVKLNGFSYTSTFLIEGPENMTEAALKSAIMSRYL